MKTLLIAAAVLALQTIPVLAQEVRLVDPRNNLYQQCWYDEYGNATDCQYFRLTCYEAQAYDLRVPNQCRNAGTGGGYVTRNHHKPDIGDQLLEGIGILLLEKLEDELKR